MQLVLFNIVRNNIYTYLSSISSARPYLLKNKREILFKINEDYGLIISFKNLVRKYNDEEEELDVDFEEERELSIISPSELNELPALSQTEYVQIYTSEIYGCRESSSMSDFSQKSISKTLYRFLRELYILDSTLNIEYKLDTNEGFEDWGSMCSAGDYFNYLFLVKLQCSGDQLIDVVNLLIKVNENSSKSSAYIVSEYVNLKKFVDSKKIKIINTNTKARRLGYFKLLGRFFEKFTQTPVNSFYKKYESFAASYRNDLKESINTKGIITLNRKGIATGSSAKPYIEIANNLGYINRLNRVATVSKGFKVYVELLNRNDSTENPFTLNLLDKLFFGESILKEDFLYISVLLEIIYIRQNFLFIDLKKIYQNYLLKRLKYFQQEYFYMQDRKIAEGIKRIEARIASWEEPEVYLEHVLMPRLNWLVDLDLIKLEKSSKREVAIAITQEGDVFFECMCDWYDLKFDWILNPDEFIASFLPQTFAKAYNVNEVCAPDYEQVKAFVLGKINECFNIFRTMAANRITLSQTISFVKYSALIECGLCLSQTYVDSIIRNEFKDLFIYKFQGQFNDGYLQKLKP